MPEYPQHHPNLLDVPVSFFEYDHKRNTFANVPSQKTTLRRMVTTRYYQAPIEQIRAEPDKTKQDELKKYQPAFTPVALLNHRKRDTSFVEKIQQQWPMIMGDVDKKDNSTVDMAELKKDLSRLPYVLLCAYSVRGGLWFVVRLPDIQTPDTLITHFRYLQKLFSETFAIKLDSTKGGNPTDLRFVSYDADPYINDGATVMKVAYTLPSFKRPTVAYAKGKTEDEGTLLKRLVSYVEKAGDGQRHESLLKAARLAGGFVGAGRMDEQNAVLALETVASEWPQFAKSQKTIRDGIRYGQATPIYPEERPMAAPPVRDIAYNPLRKSAPKSPADSSRLIVIDVNDIYKRIDIIVSEPEPCIVESEQHDLTATPTHANQEVVDTSSILLTKPPFKLPALIESMWQQFSRPPLWYNLIAAHKALLRCLEPDEPLPEIPVTNAPTATRSNTNESQLERLIVEPVNSYPADWDVPNPPDAVPTIRIHNNPESYFEWQRSHSHFSQMGIASLQTNYES